MTVGIDEVGRGCWAGPLVVGAVALKTDIVGLTDSKRLSKQERSRLAELIQNNAYVGLGWVSNAEIDDIGLSSALRLAAERATADFPLERTSQIIIDGNQNFLPGVTGVITAVKADLDYPCVSAASIVAKVARDEYMAEQAARYPGFGFERHVGYGTKHHLEALLIHGVTPLHRTSFAPIRKLLEGKL
jgi:ribonuclease HII